MATLDWELVGILRRLFEACRDGASGYRMAAGPARDAGLKFLFQAHAEQRARFATELQAELRRLGVRDRKSGPITEALHRGWAGVKAAVTGGSDEALLAACERAEDGTKKLFREALLHDLPTDVQALVRRQGEAVHEAYDRIRLSEIAAW
jgi:uncharacterized protein (TIGR02284 family)